MSSCPVIKQIALKFHQDTDAKSLGSIIIQSKPSLDPHSSKIRGNYSFKIKAD